MTNERKELIQKFEKWFATKPNPIITAAECANIAEKYAESKIKKLTIHDVSKYPSELEPVLAKIEHINSLGKSTWYEVVYYDGHWKCYNGSTTFKDGEKVVKWRYCKDCC